jgi:predicted XRE-type DNA-binding protein
MAAARQFIVVAKLLQREGASTVSVNHPLGSNFTKQEKHQCASCNIYS